MECILNQSDTTSIDERLNIFLLESTIELDTLSNQASFISFFSESGGGLLSAIQNIVNKILQVITDFISMIGSMFNFKGSVSADEYIRSGALDDKFQSDYQQLEREGRKKIAQGSKLCQAISSATGIDDAEVQKYVQSAEEFLKGVAPVAITTVTGFALTQGIRKVISMNKTDVKKAGKCATYTRENSLQKIQRIISTMGSINNRMMKSSKELIAEIKKRKK